jgi:hypothetical protein
VAIVVVGGSTKDIGKTSLVCGVISALSDFGWTAVKITGHDYAREVSSLSHMPESTDSRIWEEANAGQDTDTARYLAAGARRAVLITRDGPEIPIEAIGAAIAKDRNVIFESNRIIDAVQPDICLALVGSASREVKPSFARLLNKADALVTLDGVVIESANIPHFHLLSPDHLSTEMVSWLRSRLESASHRPLKD